MNKKKVFICIIMCIVLLSHLFMFETDTEYHENSNGKATISAGYEIGDLEYFKSNEHELSIRDVLRNNNSRVVWFLLTCLLFMIVTNCGNLYIYKRFCWITSICCIRKRYLICYIHKKDGKK